MKQNRISPCAKTDANKLYIDYSKVSRILDFKVGNTDFNSVGLQITKTVPA